MVQFREGLRLRRSVRRLGRCVPAREYVAGRRISDREIRVGQGPKGRQIDQVVSVDESTAEAPAQRRPQFARPRTDAPRRQVDLSSAVEMMGTVKWYNPDKGFGFITPQNGGKDVFIHATVLERAGLGPLQEGQSVRMGVVQGAKGPEAGTISVD
jgi:CspA family cold shock protein